MRLVRFGEPGRERPGLVDAQGTLRDLSGHLEDIDPGWHGIGVRIEDDVLVTPTGHDVLTAAIPKRVDEIDAIRASSSS